MRDLKHLIYFENLLQQANNDLVQDACKDGELTGYVLTRGVLCAMRRPVPKSMICIPPSHSWIHEADYWYPSTVHSKK